MPDHQHDHHAHAHAHAHDHAHEHGHGHSHAHGHNHAHGVTNEKRIGWAFVIILIFMFIELGGGLVSGSLALLADAGHMVSDAAALGMSWFALRIGRRPADGTLSYGYKRMEVLAAFVNGCMLFLIAAWIIYEAVRRFAAPVAIEGPVMLTIAVIGLAANAAAFMVLMGGNRDNLNMKSAWLHVLGDMLGSVAAIVAAIVVLLTGFTPIDPILSILVALLILKSAAGIVRSSARILLEGAPEGLDLAVVRRDLIETLPNVADVHHLHAWCLSAEQSLVTLHVTPVPGSDPMGLPAAVAARLAERFSIGHATVQVEDGACTDATPTAGTAAAGAPAPGGHGAAGPGGAEKWQCL